MAWAVCINNTFGKYPYNYCGLDFAHTFCLAGLLSITFPRLQSAFTPTGACKSTRPFIIKTHFLTFPAVGFYAGLNLVAWFMIFCFVRETKQLTLEELDRKC